MPEETRTLLIETVREELQLEVPAKWKITFGALQPGQSQSYGRDTNGTVLRIYESDKQQRAVFRDVLSFRDLSMPLKRRVVTTKENKKGKHDSKGNAEYEAAVEVDDEWEDA